MNNWVTRKEKINQSKYCDNAENESVINREYHAKSRNCI